MGTSVLTTELATATSFPPDEIHNCASQPEVILPFWMASFKNYRKLVMDLGMFGQKQCEPDSSDPGLHRKSACPRQIP